MLLGLYFLIVVALPLGLGSYVVYNGLPRSTRCPTCAGDTLRLESRLHALASRALRRNDLHLRWCMTCGWCGAAKIPRPAAPRVRPSAVSNATTDSGDRVDVRSINVDGSPWRVMVECWAEEGRWVARLVFVAPGGRSWADQRSFEGSSPVSVISQAFALPEQTLAGRLRRVLH